MADRGYNTGDRGAYPRKSVVAEAHAGARWALRPARIHLVEEEACMLNHGGLEQCICWGGAYAGAVMSSEEWQRVAYRLCHNMYSRTVGLPFSFTTSKPAGLSSSKRLPVRCLAALFQKFRFD